MSPEFNYLTAFLIGIAGSVHCVSMCGGIVGALTAASPGAHVHLSYMLAYNSGRILSYASAGAVAGYLGSIASHSADQGIQVLNLLSGLFLILLACYIGNWWRILTVLESAGRTLWKHLQPLSKRFLPMRSPVQALPYGFIWGWLPCGLVYSTLTWSVASGDAVTGALVMVFFGVGTLPSLLLVAMSANTLLAMLKHRFAKQFIAITLLTFAFLININTLIHW